MLHCDDRYLMCHKRTVLHHQFQALHITTLRSCLSNRCVFLDAIVVLRIGVLHRYSTLQQDLRVSVVSASCRSVEAHCAGRAAVTEQVLHTIRVPTIDRIEQRIFI